MGILFPDWSFLGSPSPTGHFLAFCVSWSCQFGFRYQLALLVSFSAYLTLRTKYFWYFKMALATQIYLFILFFILSNLVNTLFNYMGLNFEPSIFLVILMHCFFKFQNRDLYQFELFNAWIADPYITFGRNGVGLWKICFRGLTAKEQQK